jgi:hypothetical protein
LAAFLAIFVVNGIGLLQGTRFEWISNSLLMLGFRIPGLFFPDGIHSDHGLGFLIFGIGLNFLIAWFVALLLIEILLLVVHKGMKTE